jgi:hypothetical protein
MKIVDRAILSIGPALSLAFLLGIIAAMDLLGRDARLRLGLIGAVVVALTGPASVIGLLAAAAFALIYLGMIKFAHFGDIALGVALFIAGGLAMLPLAQLRVTLRTDSTGPAPTS